MIFHHQIQCFSLRLLLYQKLGRESETLEHSPRIGHGDICNYSGLNWQSTSSALDQHPPGISPIPVCRWTIFLPNRTFRWECNLFCLPVNTGYSPSKMTPGAILCASPHPPCGNGARNDQGCTFSCRSSISTNCEIRLARVSAFLAV